MIGIVINNQPQNNLPITNATKNFDFDINSKKPD
jgi:hypothetical protein